MKTSRSRKKLEVDSLFTNTNFEMKLLNRPTAKFLLCPGHIFAAVFILFEVNFSFCFFS